MLIRVHALGIYPGRSQPDITNALASAEDRACMKAGNHDNSSFLHLEE